MTCNDCAHCKVCAEKKAWQRFSDVENRCQNYLNQDRLAVFPKAVGEPIWIFDKDRIEKVIVYHIRLNIESCGDCIIKGQTEMRVQTFVQTDAGRVIEVLPKHIGKMAFLTFEDAEMAAINTDNSAEQIRYHMFRDYLLELQKIEGLTYMNDAQILDNFVKIRSGKTGFWKDVYPDQSRQDKYDMIGFWVLGAKGNCHPDADYFIAESYIKPEYRREGIMSDRISDWIKTYGGMFCLFVLNNNEIAKKFWNKLFDDLGYEKFELSDTGAYTMDGHLIQIGYRPKQKIQ